MEPGLAERRVKRVLPCRPSALASDEPSRADKVEPKPALSPGLAAVRQAEREGLTLLACPTMMSGFHGVLRDSTTAGLVKPFRVQVRRGGVRITLGRFGTAEEAALCYARSPEGLDLRARMLAAIEKDLNNTTRDKNPAYKPIISMLELAAKTAQGIKNSGRMLDESDLGGPQGSMAQRMVRPKLIHGPTGNFQPCHPLIGPGWITLLRADRGS
jgi:hypothetical protein